jgi:hypothetical protein
MSTNSGRIVSSAPAALSESSAPAKALAQTDNIKLVVKMTLNAKPFLIFTQTKADGTSQEFKHEIAVLNTRKNAAETWEKHEIDPNDNESNEYLNGLASAINAMITHGAIDPNKIDLSKPLSFTFALHPTALGRLKDLSNFVVGGIFTSCVFQPDETAELDEYEYTDRTGQLQTKKIDFARFVSKDPQVLLALSSSKEKIGKSVPKLVHRVLSDKSNDEQEPSTKKTAAQSQPPALTNSSNDRVSRTSSVPSSVQVAALPDATSLSAPVDESAAEFAALPTNQKLETIQANFQFYKKAIKRSSPGINPRQVRDILIKQIIKLDESVSASEKKAVRKTLESYALNIGVTVVTSETQKEGITSAQFAEALFLRA